RRRGFAVCAATAGDAVERAVRAPLPRGRRALRARAPRARLLLLHRGAGRTVVLRLVTDGDRATDGTSGPPHDDGRRRLAGPRGGLTRRPGRDGACRARPDRRLRTGVAPVRRGDDGRASAERVRAHEQLLRRAVWMGRGPRAGGDAPPA